VTVVLDASVMVKWLLEDPQQEPGTDKATQLLERVVQGRESILQPPHWLVEVGAVLARLSPATAADDIVMLSALELPSADDPGILRRGCELAIELEQHLFDTLYHAVALETPDATLITADERYLRAAQRLGGIMNLTDWAPPSGG
jgi:predicted nucleic acid-binding protein